MIHITERKAKYAGSCNFCNRGDISGEHKILPYRNVYELIGDNGTTVRICRKCLDIITEFNKRG